MSTPEASDTRTLSLTGWQHAALVKILERAVMQQLNEWALQSRNGIPQLAERAKHEHELAVDLLALATLPAPADAPVKPTPPPNQRMGAVLPGSGRVRKEGESS